MGCFLNGLVIDGRNRFCASIKLGKDVRLERFNPSDPIQYVLSENLERRHLTSQQKAVVAVRSEALYGIFADEAKERQGERTDLKSDNNIPQNFAECESNQKPVNHLSSQQRAAVEVNPVPVKREESETRQKIAKLYGTNRDYVSKAKKVKDHAPELLPKVASGEVDLNDAAKVAGQRKKEMLSQ